MLGPKKRITPECCEKPDVHIDGIILHDDWEDNIAPCVVIIFQYYRQ